MKMETNRRPHLPSVEMFFSSVTPVSGQVRFHMIEDFSVLHRSETRKPSKKSGFCRFLECHPPVFYWWHHRCPLYWSNWCFSSFICFLYFSGEHTKWNPQKVAKTCSDLAVHLPKSVHRGCVLVELVPNLDMKFFGRRKLADAWRSCLLTSCCSRQCDNLSTPSIWCSCGSAALRD